MRDPYQVLGVSKTASAAEIKQAFRKLAKEYHPDSRPNDPKVAERFKEISAAHQLLGNAEKRGQYDRGEINADGTPRAPQFHGFQHAGGGGGAPFEFEFSSGGARPGGAGGAGGPDDFLSEFFSGIRGAGRRAFRSRGEDLKYTLAVSFLDAARGGKERIKLPNGKTLDVAIPAGVKDGQQIRLRGQGGEGSGGGPAGDALVQITVKPHPFFERDGDHIRVSLPISLPEAVLGGKVEVPTIDGNVTMSVPENANSGDKLRLKGKGLPQAGGKGRGDQLVTLQIRLPDGGDRKLRDFVEEWGKQQVYNPRAGLKI